MTTVDADTGELLDAQAPALSLFLSLGLQGAERLFNQALATDPFTQEKLATLAGKILCLVPSDFEPVYICVLEQGIELSPLPHKTDVRIEASPFTLMRLALLADPDALQAGDVHISGDAAIAQQFSQCLLQLDIDWEEALSKRVGDVAAHQVGRVLRFAHDKLRGLGQTWQDNMLEYFQEEAQVLPPKAAIQAWAQAVDILGSDVNDLERRLQALEEKNNAKP